MKIKLPDNVVPLPRIDRTGRIPRHGYASIRPAARWQEALIGGNGSVETKIFGIPSREIVLFRHEGMLEPELPDGWTHPPEPPAIAAALPRVRELLLEGEYGAANDFAFKVIRESGYPERIPNNRRCEGFALMIDTEIDGESRDYLRTVDFRSGMSSVAFTDGTGPWLRESFVSRPDSVCAIRIVPPAAYAGRIVLRVALPSEAAADGTEEYAPRRSVMEPSMTVRTVYRQGEIFIEGSSDLQSIPEAGYCGLLKIVAPGAGFEHRDDGLELVTGSEILILAALEWKIDYAGNPKAVKDELTERIESAGTDFKSLLATHTAWQSKVFDRSSIELASDDELLLTTEELLAEQQRSEGFSGALIEKIYDMGRYLQLYSHGKFPYVWGHVNVNVNLQVASGVQTRTPETMETYFSWIESLHDDWRRNAGSIFGFRGLLSSVHPDGLNGILFHMTPLSPHHYWIAGAGWCYQPFWEHYQTTGDRSFARDRIYPALKEIAQFFEDYLTLRDDKGKYIFAPSYSPENWPGHLDQSRCVVINSVMDISVCREVLVHLLELNEHLELGDPDASTWGDMLSALPDYLIDDLGALKEWAWADLPERFDHRHLSHLYGVWPGDEIRQDIEPELAGAALLANRKRAQGNASIHGIMHRALAAARLRDRLIAGTNLRQVLDQGYLNPGSMMTNHNPYRIYCPDACGSLPVLIVEMLLYSRPGVIELLPAVPEGLGKGVLRGIAARTQVIVRELSWDLGAGRCRIDLESLVDQRVEIRAPVDPDRNKVTEDLKAGEVWDRTFEW